MEQYYGIQITIDGILHIAYGKAIYRFIRDTHSTNFSSKHSFLEYGSSTSISELKDNLTRSKVGWFIDRQNFISFWEQNPDIYKDIVKRQKLIRQGLYRGMSIEESERLL